MTCKPKQNDYSTGRLMVSGLVLAVAFNMILSPAAQADAPQDAGQSAGEPPSEQAAKPPAKVIGLKYNCVHVLQLEKTLKLYREVLGFKMAEAEVLHGPALEGMLIMKMRAGEFTVCLSLTAPENLETVGPIGNTNHNHFMLLVNDIVPICDRLKEEGYALENEAYAQDKYSFFKGPNGEIIGLTEYK